jgi:hypothetical protein
MAGMALIHIAERLVPSRHLPFLTLTTDWRQWRGDGYIGLSHGLCPFHRLVVRDGLPRRRLAFKGALKLPKSKQIQHF